MSVEEVDKLDKKDGKNYARNFYTHKKQITKLPVDDSEYGDSEKQKFESAQQIGRPGDQVLGDSPAAEYGAMGKTQLKGIINAARKKAGEE